MTRTEVLYNKMISRRTNKGWNEEDSKYDLFKILTDTTRTDQKVRDLVYWDFATEKQARDYLTEAGGE
jgi:hypothetical protein